MPNDWEIYYIPHQFTGQPVPCRRPISRPKGGESMPLSPLEATLRRLEAACKLAGVMMADKSSYTDAQRAEVKADIERIREEVIADAAEGML